MNKAHPHHFRGVLYAAGSQLWQRTPARVRERLVRWARPQYTVGVIGLVPDAGDRILVFRHRFRVPFAWGLPGGFIELGETPNEAFERELGEEAGIEVRSERGVYLMELNHSTRSVSYVVKAEAMHEAPLVLNDAEILDARWVDPATLPSGLHPTHARLLERYWRRESGEGDNCWVVR